MKKKEYKKIYVELNGVKFKGWSYKDEIYYEESTQASPFKITGNEKGKVVITDRSD